MKIDIAAGSPIKNGAKFEGIFCQPGKIEPFPMHLAITDLSGSNFAGKLVWPQQDNSETSCVGTISEDSVHIAEFEIVKGKRVGVPNIYKGVVVGTSLSGICYHGNERGTFCFALVK